MPWLQSPGTSPRGRHTSAGWLAIPVLPAGHGHAIRAFQQLVRHDNVPLDSRNERSALLPDELFLDDATVLQQRGRCVAILRQRTLFSNGDDARVGTFVAERGPPPRTAPEIDLQVDDALRQSSFLRRPGLHPDRLDVKPPIDSIAGSGTMRRTWIAPALRAVRCIDAGERRCAFMSRLS